MRPLLLFLVFSSTAFAAREKVIKFETLSESTSLSRPNESYCITRVAPTAVYQTIRNARGLRQYICEVGFEAQSRNDRSPLQGVRTITYRTTPVILERNHLRPQGDYLRELEDSEHMMGYVAIPNSVYGMLPNVSRRDEEARIARDAYALIPSDQAFGTAVKTACYVAMLETLSMPCSSADLDQIRADVERKLRDLNTNQTQVIYTTQEHP